MHRKKDRKESTFPIRAFIGCTVFFICTAACIGMVISAIIQAFGKNKEETIPEISFRRNEAVRIMDTPVTLAEFMLYTVGIKTPYDEAHGEEYWSEYSYNAQGVKESNETIVKEEIADSIRLVKVLCAAEKKYGVSLSKEEEDILKANAVSYYDSLIKNGVDDSFLTSGIVNKYVREQYLSEKVYNCIKELHGDGGEEETELSEALMGEIADLLDQYDGNYRYSVSINWPLLRRFRFYEYFDPDKEDMDDAIHYLLNQRDGGTEE